MELSKLQKEILLHSPDRSIVMASAASGKALNNSSILYTSTGTIKIGDAKVGNKIFGEDGQLHTIIGVFPQGKKQEFTVTFSDGTKINCCEEHLWTFQTESLRSKRSNKWITCSLRELINNYPLYIDARAKNNFGNNKTKRKNIFIPMTAPVNFAPQEILLEPYTMGALLGDGGFTTSTFTNEDEDVLKWINEGLSEIGCSLKYKDRFDYTINSNYTQNYSKILKHYNLWNKKSNEKFIPKEYKYNSVENRIKLLEGLIDTDGSCAGSSYDIILKSKQLILDCKEICESLGLTATYSEKKAICTNSTIGPKDCGIVYRLRIKTSKLIPKLHRSKRREAQWKPTKIYSFRAIIDIQPTNNYADMTCITVDNPTQLFLTNDFIVTHNTRLLTEKARQLINDGVEPSSIAVITFTNLAASELKQRLAADYKTGLFIGTIHALANFMLCSHGYDTKNFLNEEKFDMLFQMIHSHPDAIHHYQWILLDEAQDTSQEQFEFIFDMINPTHFFVCGDLKQCQPAGTQILLRGGNTKPIEQINIGDEIVWYNNSQGQCCSLYGTAYNAIHKTVQKIRSRVLENEYLITIQTDEGHKSTYTANHRTFVKMRDDTDYQYVVYLMCKDNRFRVGKIPLRGTATKNGNPWRNKMSAEGCDKIWLLKIFQTDKEARVYEQKISYFYQIPQTCWQYDKVQWTQEDINYIYAGIDTYTNAKKCLSDHKLDINYPMIDKNQDWSFNQKFASNATSQLYAINIIPEIMDCVVYDANVSRHKRFVHMTAQKYIPKQPITVYSLEVEGGTYVADGIITHNSIYQWRDARPDILKSMAAEPSIDVFDLNENYRNGSSILSYAKSLIQPNGLYDTSIAMRPERGFSTSIRYNLDEIASLIKSKDDYSDWCVLCRINSQIEKASRRFAYYGIPIETFHLRGMTIDQLNKKMQANTVKVLTIHAAKGLEWKNVIVIGANPYSSFEERNICYVAATRARDNLYWVKGGDVKKKYR